MPLLKNVILSVARRSEAESCEVEGSHVLPEILRLRFSLLRREKLRSG